MRTIGDLGQGGAGLNDRLPLILKELQSIKHTVVSGGAANAALTLTGIKVGDTVASIVNLTDSTQVTEAATITANTIKLPTTDTTSKKLLVVWFAA